MTITSPVTCRRYAAADEPSWLRCRVLSFLGTQYYDDVHQSRHALDEPAIALVAVTEGDGSGQGEVLGILDVEIDGELATIDTLAVHPDHEGHGIASALLTQALQELQPLGVTAIDAWTREDVASNRWYEKRGFTAEQHYLHVHKEHDDDGSGFSSPAGISAPVRAFAHARLEQEDELRGRYRRVYVCRRYVRELA